MQIPQTELVGSVEGREIYREVLPPGKYVIGREVDAQIRLACSTRAMSVNEPIGENTAIEWR